MFGIDLRRALLPPRGWRRAVALRRAAAAVLVVLAVVLALAPRAVAPSAQVVVATHDLAAGVPLGPADLAVRAVPAELVPAGALGGTTAALGRLLVGGVRTGEALTDVRLLGRPAAVAAAHEADAAGVPLRLADPAVAGLLTAGSRVDVVGVGDTGGRPGTTAGTTSKAGPVPHTSGAPRPPVLGTPTAPGAAAGTTAGVEAGGPGVLAAGAVVLGVLPGVERSATGPVVVVALPGELAARVAAATLSQEVTVTLR